MLGPCGRCAGAQARRPNPQGPRLGRLGHVGTRCSLWRARPGRRSRRRRRASSLQSQRARALAPQRRVLGAVRHAAGAPGGCSGRPWRHRPAGAPSLPAGRRRRAQPPEPAEFARCRGRSDHPSFGQGGGVGRWAPRARRY
eukprot:2141060-Alexandrium_andersonii.AAC.1